MKTPSCAGSGKRLQPDRRGLPAPARRRRQAPARCWPACESLVRRDVPNILLSHNPNSFRAPPNWASSCRSPATRMAARCASKFSIIAGAPRNFSRPTSPGFTSARSTPHPIRTSKQFRDLRTASMLQSPASSIYVNRGLGTIGAPVRLGVPPEITLITLRRAV